MTIVAETYTYVVGVDTHAATHHYAIIETRTGGLVDDAQFPTTTAGLSRALDWIARRTGTQTDGDVSAVLVSIEGTRSYGTRLTALLVQVGYRVVDAPSPTRERGSAKNDRIDALIAARGSLHKPQDSLADARTGTTSASLQILLSARNSISAERTRAINALTALLRSHDLGIDARHRTSATTVRLIASWRTRKHDTVVQTIARAEAIRLASHILVLQTELATNERSLHDIVEQTAPSLLDLFGVGPVNAAIVLTAWSHPGRIRTEASFAKLSGVCPLQVASGRSNEHRLNRTGDRQLNRALHSIAKTRMQFDPTTRDYVARRSAHAMTRPRIRRCLKRYIARELFRHLAALPTT